MFDFSNTEGYAIYTILPRATQNTNQKHLLLTGNYDSNFKLSQSILLEKGNLNISKNLSENCVLEGLCVPSKFL